MDKEFEVIKIEIAKLDLNPGDTLAVSIKTKLPEKELEYISSGLKNTIPDGVKVIIFDGREVEFTVWKATQACGCPAGVVHYGDGSAPCGL